MFPDLKGGSFGQLELFGGLKLPLYHDVAIQRTEADWLVHQRNACDFAEMVPGSLYAGPIFMGTLPRGIRTMIHSSAHFPSRARVTKRVRTSR